MPGVVNWQIGRMMKYEYPESRPDRQVAAVFDINKCIGCQTCTLSCKTTWTSGKGQEYMLWNSVETKPWGSYPLGWDANILDDMGGPDPGGGRDERRARPVELPHEAPAPGLAVLSRAHLHALHVPGLPRGLPAGGDLQAEGGRHRPDRPAAVPRLPGA